MSNWWKKTELIPYTDKTYINIFSFYVHNCPVVFKRKKKDIVCHNKVSCRGVDFYSKGWDNNTLKTLLSKMKNNNGNRILYECTTSDKIESKMQEFENSTKSCVEAIVFVENCDIYKTQSIFYAIRNAFAHGSFSVDQSNKMYYFESEKEGKIKAQICLKESTLLYWIDLFNSPKKIAKKKSSKSRKMKRGALKLAA